MRFLHTADWQIGMRAQQVGEAGQRVRQERLAAAARVVAAARDNGAEFILLAGDTFEHNGVDRLLVQQAGDLLARFDRPVYVIPGNHDPLTPGSVWEHPVWRAPNLHVLRQAAPAELESVEILPCPLQEAHGRRNPTAWIPATPGARVRIGLAHGHVEGIQQEEPDYPIPRDAAQRAGLDYLALGHWHSHAGFEDEHGIVRMAYSGTHEPTSFGERDSGNALLVEIAAPGAAPTIQRVQTGGLRWLQFVEELRAAGQLEEVANAIEAIAAPETALVSVRLSGLVFAGEMGKLAQLRDVLASRFLYARLDEAGLRPAPDDAAWLDALPEGVLREAAARLRELADPGYAGTRAPEAGIEAATHALMELYAMAGEVRQ